MSQTQPYERLRVFKRAMRLVQGIYDATASFPEQEKSGLTATLRRGAAALPGKVADAAGREDAADAAKAFRGAAGALRELETTLLVARRMKMIGGWSLRQLRHACRRLDAAIVAEIAACEMELVETTVEGADTTPDLRLAA